jgi:hypothetical protein
MFISHLAPVSAVRLVTVSQVIRKEKKHRKQIAQEKKKKTETKKTLRTHLISKVGPLPADHIVLLGL